MPANWIPLDAWFNQAHVSDMSLLMVVMMVAIVLIFTTELRILVPRAIPVVRAFLFTGFIGITCLTFAFIAFTGGLH